MASPLPLGHRSAVWLYRRGVNSSGDPIGAFLLVGSAFCILAAMYVVSYTFFMANWEGWESWHARTGLDGDRAAEERANRQRK
jgi:hypothetical protein